MNNEELANMLQNLMSNMNSNSNENNQDSYINEDDGFNNNINFDFDTIMKIKSIMDKFNANKNSPEANLLMSLKPYLNNNRKQKLDQYIQFLNIAKIIESFNDTNSEVNSK